MYRIADKYKSMVFKYAFTKLDLNGIYTKETWNKAGFKDSILIEVK
jgi:hypothetical protein